MKFKALFALMILIGIGLCNSYWTPTTYINYTDNSLWTIGLNEDLSIVPNAKYAQRELADSVTRSVLSSNMRVAFIKNDAKQLYYIDNTDLPSCIFPACPIKQIPFTIPNNPYNYYWLNPTSWDPTRTKLTVWVVGVSNATGSYVTEESIYTVNIDGTGQQKLSGGYVTDGLVNAKAPAWSPDGLKIAFMEMFNTTPITVTFSPGETYTTENGYQIKVTDISYIQGQPGSVSGVTIEVTDTTGAKEIKQFMFWPSWGNGNGWGDGGTFFSNKYEKMPDIKLINVNIGQTSSAILNISFISSGLYTISPTGTNKVKIAGIPLDSLTNADTKMRWSNDGKYIVYTARNVATGITYIWKISADGTTKTQITTTTDSQFPAWSADDKWILFNRYSPTWNYQILKISSTCVEVPGNTVCNPSLVLNDAQGISFGPKIPYISAGQNWVCGNGICEQGEDNQNCPQDCVAVCGNGICETGETPANCPQDCPASGGRQVIDIYPGWNLISNDINWELSTCSKATTQNPLIYNKETGTYAASTGITSIIKPITTAKQTAYWYKSTKKCKITLNKATGGNTYPLNKGQNYIAVTQEMSNKTLYKIQNDCKINKIYYYNAKNKQWTKIYTGTDLTKHIGYGIMIETKTACTLKIK